MDRRGFLIGLAAGICAPAIVRPGILMPIKKVLVSDFISCWVINGYDQFGNPLQVRLPGNEITSVSWTDAYKKFKQVGVIIGPDGGTWSRTEVQVNDKNIVYHARDIVSFNSKIRIAGEWNGSLWGDHFGFISRR